MPRVGGRRVADGFGQGPRARTRDQIETAAFYRGLVHRVALLPILGLMTALAVVACSGTGDSTVSAAVVTHTRGLPPSASESIAPATGTPKPFATWAGPRQIYVTTWGSSSCPSLPSSVHADGAHTLLIKTAEHYLHKADDACTSDLAATTSTVDLPSMVDETAALSIRIDGTTTRLGARTR